MTRPRLVVLEEGAPAERRHANLGALAYERLEALIVCCELRPGRLLTTLDLQGRIGLGRTPVHQAVNRLAADTLLLVRPRHGLQIAPIDLARERRLVGVRRDLERFVIRLATERAGTADRNGMLHLAHAVRERGASLTIDAFNRFDRRLDAVLLAAAGEPFLAHTLAPLRTLCRRAGWICHTHLRHPAETLARTVACHLALLDAVANRREAAAIEASDALMDHMDAIFEALEHAVDPALLDCSLQPLRPF